MFSPGVTSLIEGVGPFVGQYFDSDSKASLDYIRDVRVLVIGAGGLGCEILKSLAFNGFKHIDIIDMDQIDISNLNRQFLFRQKDVGRYKSEVAAEYIRNRVRGRFGKIKYTDKDGKEVEDDIEINYKTCKIQELPDEYYVGFHLVIGGLDNVEARLWLSSKLVEIAKKTNNDVSIPYIDGGTTAWSGNIMSIFPNQNACMECQRKTFSRPTQFQSCTLVSHPRKPEHCIHYAYQNLWDKLRKGEKFDGDNDEHCQWITDKALEHAKKFNLDYPIDYRLTRKVLKNTVAAIASTQAVIASLCVTEAIKIISDCAPLLSNKVNPDFEHNPVNNVLFDGNSEYLGANLSTLTYARVPNCPVCRSNTPQIKYNPDETVGDFLKRLAADINFPDATSLIKGKQNIVTPLIESTKDNLTKKMSEFGFKVGDQIGGSSSVHNKDFIAVLT